MLPILLRSSAALVTVTVIANEHAAEWNTSAHSPATAPFLTLRRGRGHGSGHGRGSDRAHHPYRDLSAVVLDHGGCPESVGGDLAGRSGSSTVAVHVAYWS